MACTIFLPFERLRREEGASPACNMTIAEPPHPQPSTQGCGVVSILTENLPIILLDNATPSSAIAAVTRKAALDYPTTTPR